MKKIYNTNVGQIKRKFYQHQKEFNNFKDIDENVIEEIKQDVKDWDKKIFSTVYSPNMYKLSRYISIMNFVLDYNFKNHAASFDEKIVFLLYALDPDMRMYDIYQELLASFDSQSGDIFFNGLDNENEQELIKNLRDEFGFYDKTLLGYEIKFIKRFILKFAKLVSPSIWPKFKLCCLTLDNFADLDSQKNEDIILKAEDYLAKYGKVSYRNLSYQLLYQDHLLGIKKDFEKALFFILVIDKDLRMLHIYEEEATWEMVKQRIKDEFGFFSKEMVLLERDYQKRFYPNMDISFINKKES